MTELLQQGHDKLDHNTKIPGHLLQEAFPDLKGWVGSPLDVPITALIILGHNHRFPDFCAVRTGVTFLPSGFPVLSKQPGTQ